MSDSITIHESSGNVFADLGIENPEEYLAKAKLAVEIHRAIKRRRLTQASAGALIGISQPKVSDLLRGRLDGFSTDRLLRFLTLLGSDVTIRVSPPSAEKVGRVTVSAARTRIVHPAAHTPEGGASYGGRAEPKVKRKSGHAEPTGSKS